MARRTDIPALRLRWLTRRYGPTLRAALRDAGYVRVQDTHREMTVFGTLALSTAVKPMGAGSPNDD